MTEYPRNLSVDLDGPVHYVDHGGPTGAPVILCVHGLGGAALNWMSLAPLLTDRYRVLAIDLPGFGESAMGGHEVGIRAFRHLVHRFVTEVIGEPVLLAGNSMGGLISALVAVRHPGQVTGLALVNPALPLRVMGGPDPRVVGAFASTVIPGVRRLIPGRRRPHDAEEAARLMLAVCCADPTRIDEDAVAAHLEQARCRTDPRAATAFALATRSLVAAMLSPELPGRLAQVTAPVLLLHGDRDRLVPVGSARVAARAYPSWVYREATGVGHVPMLEVPRWTADQLEEWYAAKVAVRATAAA